MIWGYHHLRKHPYIVPMYMRQQILTASLPTHLAPLSSPGRSGTRMCRGSMPYQGTVEQRKLSVPGGSSHLVSVVTKHGDTASQWPKLMAKNNGGDPNYLHPLQAHPPSAGKKNHHSQWIRRTGSIHFQEILAQVCWFGGDGFQRKSQWCRSYTSSKIHATNKLTAKAPLKIDTWSRWSFP